MTEYVISERTEEEQKAIDHMLGLSPPKPAKPEPWWYGPLSFLCFGYFLVAMFATFYFEWRFAVESGFISWLFFGSWVGAFKGMAWPYFLFF